MTLNGYNAASPEVQAQLQRDPTFDLSALLDLERVERSGAILLLEAEVDARLGPAPLSEAERTRDLHSMTVALDQ